MPWLQLHLIALREHVADVEDALLESGALSITLGDPHDAPILEPGVGETPLWPTVRLSALFEADFMRELAQQRLLPLQTQLVGNARWECVEDRVWEREWLQHFQPMRFGRRLWVCPTDARIDDSDAIVVRLDPGLAFGTGTHPSTALCLEWLDANPPRGLEVIDYGCGSGILSLAAALLGARRVEALDIDPQALVATRSNATINGIDADRLLISKPEFTTPDGVDLLLANILAGVLIELAPEFATMVRAGGHAVLAGILQSQAAAVRDAYARWFECLETGDRAEWCRLVLRRTCDR